jgi:hypothetical protein
MNSWYMLFFQLPILPKLWIGSFDGVRWLFNSWSPGYQPDPGMMCSFSSSFCMRHFMICCLLLLFLSFNYLVMLNCYDANYWENNQTQMLVSHFFPSSRLEYMASVLEVFGLPGVVSNSISYYRYD